MSERDDEWMTARQAQEYLGVNKVRMSALLRSELTVYIREINRRIKWVRRADVEELKKKLYEPKKTTARAA